MHVILQKLYIFKHIDYNTKRKICKELSDYFHGMTSLATNTKAVLNELKF